MRAGLPEMEVRRPDRCCLPRTTVDGSRGGSSEAVSPPQALRALIGGADTLGEECRGCRVEERKVN